MNAPAKPSASPSIKYRKDYRPPVFTIETVKLDVQLLSAYTLVSASLAIVRQNGGKADRDLVLQGEQLELLDIAIDGEPLDASRFEISKTELTIRAFPSKATLTTTVKIYPHRNQALEGLYQSGDKYCTQCEAEGFRKITYFLDRPDVMATYEVRVEGDKASCPYLLSNGNPIASGDLAAGRHFVTWSDPFPKPSYLFALVAGDFDVLEDIFTTASGRQVALLIYVDKGKLEQCHHAMASLKKSMLWDQQEYGLEYDLDRYMIVAVSDFNMGAMENKGLNIFNTKYVLASEETATDQDFIDVEAVIAHEYFHNWTGNRVTCRDWFQLSLKEGLTVFRDQQFTADQTDETVKRIDDVKVIRASQFAEDAGPMAHPIRPDAYIEMNNFYTVTVYNKGAEVIRMIHTLLGGPGFKAGMRRYFDRHDGQAVTCDDFVSAMEDANQYDLGQFRRWYSQAGTPEVRVESHYDADTGQYRLEFRQSCPPTPGQEQKEPFLIPIKMALISRDGEVLPLSKHLTEGTERIEEGELLLLDRPFLSLTFNGLQAEPIPSLLRDFSAPVKLEYAYTPEQLVHLLGFDDNGFARWDAAQRLLSQMILAGHTEPGRALIEAFRKILSSDQEAGVDVGYLARLLDFPSVASLIEASDSVNIDALIETRKALRKHLAQALEQELAACYQRMAALNTANARALKNAALGLLITLESPDYYAWAGKQYRAAANMTDAQAALTLLANSGYSDKDSLLEHFYQRWQSDELVVNKWLQIQAGIPDEGAIERVERLLEHPAFTITNPNNIRSLIGGFAAGNLEQFHRADGAGYAFLTGQIIRLYDVNPQVAARLTGLFNRWSKFDGRRQFLMRKYLQQILEQPELSRDVYEIASKSLNNQPEP